MTKMTDPFLRPVQCGVEEAFRDFGGEYDFHRCTAQATTVVTYDSAWTRNYVIAMGGWEPFRSYVSQDGDDPGDDPGEECWGHTTEYVCDRHALALLAWISDGGDQFDRVTLVRVIPTPPIDVPAGNRADRTH